MFLESVLALAVNVAHGGTDLRIGVGLDLFQQEVEQPALSLQECQQPQWGARGFGRNGFFRRRRSQQGLDLLGERRIAQRPAHRPKGQADPAEVAAATEEQHQQDENDDASEGQQRGSDRGNIHWLFLANQGEPAGNRATIRSPFTATSTSCGGEPLPS